MAFWAWLWVGHDGFGGMERAWPSVVEGVVCIASTCCDVVLALWIEHGGRMREVRVEGGDDHKRPGGGVRGKLDGSWMEGKGQKVIAGGSAQSPWLRLRNTHIIEGEGTVLSEGDVVASRQVFKRRWKGPLWERKDRNENEADVKFGDESRRNGSKVWEKQRSNQKCRTDRPHYGVCASTADVQDNYGKRSNKIRGGGSLLL